MGQDLNWPKLADFWPNLWTSGKLKKVSQTFIKNVVIFYTWEQSARHKTSWLA